MALAWQLTLIIMLLISGAYGFAVIGQTPKGTNRRSGIASAAFMFGAFTVCIALTWNPESAWDMVGWIGIPAMLWGSWVLKLPNMHDEPTPYQPMDALKNFITCAITIALTVSIMV